MLKDFFKLNSPYESLDKASLINRMEASKHVCNVLYEPDALSEEKFDRVKFENVSFSKTMISNMTFIGCIFKNCLFIGTHFNSVSFHNCKFENCNFFKAKFQSVYARPSQFRKAIQHKKYANIAVHLYHQLRDNYYDQSQREYKNEAEYYFLHWLRKNRVLQAKRNNKKWYMYQPHNFVSFLYDFLFGYGYRMLNLFRATGSIFLLNIWANYTFSQYMFTTPVEPSLIKTIYFTVTTMTTLGATGYNPDTDIGLMFVVFNVIFGMTILSATVGALFKKILR